MSTDQQTELKNVLKLLVAPYRESDRKRVAHCLEAQGGLERCSLAFYQDEDIGKDGVWDNWRLEGPSFVWYYRGNPHVHVWVNVGDDPSVRLNDTTTDATVDRRPRILFFPADELSELHNVIATECAPVNMFAFDDDKDDSNPDSQGSSLSLSDSADVFRLDAPESRFQQLSVNQMTTLSWSISEDVTGYRQAGYSGIGVSLSKLRRHGLTKAVQWIKASRLQVSSLGWIGGFTGDNGHTHFEAIEEGRRAIKLAQGLGAKSLVLVSGTIGRHIRTHARRLLELALRELAIPAEKAGIQLALLPMHPVYDRQWSFLHSLDETMEILQKVDRPGVGMAFNPYHLWQEADLLSRIPEFASRIKLVQVADFHDPPRSDNDRLMPGTGCIPLPEILHAIADTNYQGWYEIEVWSQDSRPADYGSSLDACCRWFHEIGSGQ